MADHTRDPQPARRHHALVVVVAAVEIRVGHDRLTRDFVEADVLRREPRRAGDDDGVAHALGEVERPLQRLHGADAAAHHRGEALDAQVIRQARLRRHPVLHRHHGKVRAPGLASGRVDGRRAGGAEARTDVIGANDEEAVGVQGLARAHHVVPPADIIRVVRVDAGDVVRGVEGVADQHCVRARGIERAVGLVGDFELGQHRAAREPERFVEACLMRGDDQAGL